MQRNPAQTRGGPFLPSETLSGLLNPCARLGRRLSCVPCAPRAPVRLSVEDSHHHTVLQVSAYHVRT